MSALTDALAALQGGASTYVAPGCPSPVGVSKEPGDALVVVVLPQEGSATPQEVAQQLDAALTPGTHVFAVQVGNSTAGYSTLLDSVQTAGMMQKAQDVSSSPSAALGVFTTLVHRYQATSQGKAEMSKLQTTTTTTQQPHQESLPVAPVAGVSVALLLALVAAVVVKVLKPKKPAQPKPAELQKREVTQEELQLWSATVATDDLPSAAAAAFKHISEDVDDLAGLWGEITDADVRFKIQSICYETIPKTLKLWRKIPADLKNSPSEVGPSPNQALVDAFEAIEHGLATVKKAAYSGTIEQLNVEAAFAKLKYTDSTSPFELDATPASQEEPVLVASKHRLRRGM